MTFDKNNEDLLTAADKKAIVCPSSAPPLKNKAPPANKPDRDLSASSRYCQVGSTFTATIADTITEIEYHASKNASSYSSLFTNIMGFILGFIAIIIGKILLPLFSPILRYLAKKLGFSPKSNFKMSNSNIWHRSFRSAGLFAWNLFTIPGTIIGYLYATGHYRSYIPDQSNITISTLITGTIAGITIGAIVSAAQYIYERRQQNNKLATAQNNKLQVESWSKRLKMGITVGNRVGILVGLIMTACTIPGLNHDIPILTTLINNACSAAGGVIGGALSLVLAPVIVWLDQYLSTFHGYQKFFNWFRAMANSQGVNNPPSNRAKAGLQLGGSIGAILGFTIGMLFPGLGNIVGASMGGAIGGLIGAIAGYASEPLLNYFKDKSVKELGSANPWSNRSRSGAIFGGCIGIVLGLLIPIPGAGSVIGSAIGSLLGAIVFTIIEPLYVEILTNIHGERIRDNPNLLQDKTGNPWTARLPIGCMIGSALGGSIGLLAAGPAGIPLGIGIGGIVGGLIGLSCTNKLRAWLRNCCSPLFNRLLTKVETLCKETSVKPTPPIAAKQPSTNIGANTSTGTNIDTSTNNDLALTLVRVEPTTSTLSPTTPLLAGSSPLVNMEEPWQMTPPSPRTNPQPQPAIPSLTIQPEQQLKREADLARNAEKIKASAQQQQLNELIYQYAKRAHQKQMTADKPLPSDNLSLDLPQNQPGRNGMV